jgi:acyl-CoA hydrolase
MPYVHGVDTAVHISDVAGVIDAGVGALPELTNAPARDIDLKVAQHIVPEICDGACIQIGIGGMANTVCEMLAAAPVKDLGVHTEMFVDSLVSLHNAGKVTGAHKRTDRFKMTYTFAAGSKQMYRFLDRNPDCVAKPVDVTNLPQNILQNDNVVSICNAAMIDLSGQVCSESAGIRHISGTGGQLQFVRGAYASRGGKSFICFASTREHHGQRTSRIVPELGPHNIVTTPRTDVMFVVTEWGMANLKGKSIPERARALISIAHPDYREELERKAREYGLIPRGVF